MSKKIYVVGAVIGSLPVSLNGKEIPLDCKDLCDGCVGVCVAFTNKKKAKKYATKKFSIVEYEVE